MWVPERVGYRELSSLPIAVWLDDAGVLRADRFFTGEDSSCSLELWDHGVVQEGSVDWTRLPGEPLPGAEGRVNGRRHLNGERVAVDI